MVEHILMTYATRRPYHAVPAVSDRAEYDPARGYWIKDGVPLVAGGEFLEVGPSTKKCDQETGEDQEGE